MVSKDEPIWIDTLYVDLIYPLIFQSREWFFSSFPFSMGDFLYLSIIGLVFIQLKKLFSKHWKDALLLLFVSASVLFIWFQLSWGINYYRTPMSEQFTAERKYGEKELIRLTEFFAARSNELHVKLSKEDSLAVEFADDTADIIKRMQLAYSVSDNVGKVKVSLFSIPLSYMGFSGYLNPFTLEAHINGRIPKIDLPLTIAHEMAHQQGYAAENEANFIGFLHAYNHPDLDIQYAASLFGFRYCYAELRKANPTKAKEIAQTLRRGIFSILLPRLPFGKHVKIR